MNGIPKGLIWRIGDVELTAKGLRVTLVGESPYANQPAVEITGVFTTWVTHERIASAPQDRPRHSSGCASEIGQPCNCGVGGDQSA